MNINRRLICEGSTTAITTGVTFYPSSRQLTWQVIQSAGTGQTVALQTSQDGTNWETLRSSTAAETLSTNEPFWAVRATCTSSSGASTAVYLTSDNTIFTDASRLR